MISFDLGSGYTPPPLSFSVPKPPGVGELAIPQDFPEWLRPPNGDVSWWPINSAQQAALCSPAELLLFGGQSGGGKTDFLVGDAMQEYQLPSFRGLLLRETLGEFDQIGDRMEAAYLPLGARYRRATGGGEWTFPSGARLRYGYLRSDKDLKIYRGIPRSWIGIDESGLHPWKRIRQLVAWLASTDQRLRVRMRLTSNPGGEGHGWQMAVFLRNRCPLHYPASRLDDDPLNTSVRAGKVYCGASWSWPPRPGDMVHKTTAFFPASVTSNPLYGQQKIDSLLSQTAEIQMQLLHGCWCNAASLYFGFLQPEWMCPYPAIEDQWWWNHFISIDYGYGNSHAAAGRFSVDEYGRVFGTGELVEKKMGAVDFAKKVCELWIKPLMGEERPRMLFVTMDPAMDSHDDTGESVFEKMEKVFNSYGVACIKSHKSPADNAQVLYNGLTDRLIILTDAMKQTFTSLQTRVIDERRAVKKIHGDPLDDLYDMVSYAYNTWLVEAVKPERLKMLERVKAMRESGADPTAIARWSLAEAVRIAQAESEGVKGLQLGKRRIGGLKVPRG